MERKLARGILFFDHAEAIVLLESSRTRGRLRQHAGHVRSPVEDLEAALTQVESFASHYLSLSRVFPSVSRPPSTLHSPKSPLT